jgi:putative hydrolase of the HAD superfamily
LDDGMPVPVEAAALLLDALGTLVWLEAPAPLLREQLARRFGLEVSIAEAERAITAEIAFYRRHTEEGRDPESLGKLRRACASELRDALPPGPRLAAVELEPLTAALLAALRFNCFDDVMATLCAARRCGLRVVIVSNWDVSLHQVLARLGVGALVDAVLTSAEVGARKPSPVIFEQALELAGVAPELAVHIGDSVAEDVEGARAAGIEPILLARAPARVPDGVRTIGSLRELGLEL